MQRSIKQTSYSTQWSQLSGRHKTIKRINPYLSLTPPVFAGAVRVDPSLCVGQFDRQSRQGILSELWQQMPRVISKINRQFFSSILSMQSTMGNLHKVNNRWEIAGTFNSLLFILFFIFQSINQSIFICPKNSISFYK